MHIGEAGRGSAVGSLSHAAGTQILRCPSVPRYIRREEQREHLALLAAMRCSRQGSPSPPLVAKTSAVAGLSLAGLVNRACCCSKAAIWAAVREP